MIANSPTGRRWEYLKHPTALLPKEGIGQISKRVEDCIKEHPIPCLAGAVLLGVTLGWLVKRR